MSAALYTDEQNNRAVFLLFSAMQTTGAAQVLSFTVPINCTITSFSYAVDTEGNADNVHTADLRTGATALLLPLLLTLSRKTRPWQAARPPTETKARP
jgi:hypothetical protein